MSFLRVRERGEANVKNSQTIILKKLYIDTIATLPVIWIYNLGEDTSPNP